MTEDTLVHKIASMNLTEELDLYWYLTEQPNGRLLNQIVVGTSGDELGEFEPEFDINIDIGGMQEARHLWNNLVKLVELLKEKSK